MKPFPRKVGPSVRNYLFQNLVKGSFLQKCFEAILSSKTNVLSVRKEYFLFFWKSLSDEIENIYWESQAKCQRLFKSKLDCRKVLRKWF